MQSLLRAAHCSCPLKCAYIRVYICNLQYVMCGLGLSPMSSSACNTAAMVSLYHNPAKLPTGGTNAKWTDVQCCFDLTRPARPEEAAYRDKVTGPSGLPDPGANWPGYPTLRCASTPALRFEPHAQKHRRHFYPTARASSVGRVNPRASLLSFYRGRRLLRFISG